MKLYDDARAPNPRRVRIYLAEKGLTVPTVQVSVAEKQNTEAEHIGRNPRGLVPVLELDDGSFLTESIAICRYFEALHPEPPLFGTTPLEQARVEEWQRIAELEVLLRVSLVFQNESPYWVGRREQAPAFAGQERPRLELALAQVDDALAGRTFLVGERPTVADITLFVALDFMRVLKRRLDDRTPNLQRFHAAMAERPSAKA